MTPQTNCYILPSRLEAIAMREHLSRFGEKDSVVLFSARRELHVMLRGGFAVPLSTYGDRLHAQIYATPVRCCFRDGILRARYESGVATYDADGLLELRVSGTWLSLRNSSGFVYISDEIAQTLPSRYLQVKE